MRRLARNVKSLNLAPITLRTFALDLRCTFGENANLICPYRHVF